MEEINALKAWYCHIVRLDASLVVLQAALESIQRKETEANGEWGFTV
jgi:hypothetical protein